MPSNDPIDVSTFAETLCATIGPELAFALEERGFERLTPVQEAVLAPELRDRDLRISSQTGSGKTVAIGLVLRDTIRARGEGAEAGADDESEPTARAHKARPRALVVTPTRELAKQVEGELAWLYARVGARVASVTGGGGYRDELRAFRKDPDIIVGTPGRLLDHLKRGTVDASAAGAVVLDEADRMLDMGFREDIEAIFGHAAQERRTHLVSATFPRDVLTLADRLQSAPASVEGTPLGTANLDIQHLIHLVRPRERLAAIVNLLLDRPGSQTLIFARTRAGVAELSDSLMTAGFNVAMLSGEMEQGERNRALAAFKRGHVDALVATDVAARGIDVSDVSRVIHAEPPDDADSYTHRSGRTGRAGKKGTSSVLSTTSELPRITALLRRAGVTFEFRPVPTREEIVRARDERLLDELTADTSAEAAEGSEADAAAEAADARAATLAERVLASAEPERAVARLVALVQQRWFAEPQEVTPVSPPAPRPAGAERRVPAPGPRAHKHGDGWVPFRVSWGDAHGADPRRLVAMMCRRGKIEGRDIGAIRIGRTSSVVEVSASVAADFERAASRPDPRDSRIFIRRWSDESPRAAPKRPRAAGPRPKPAAGERPPARSKPAVGERPPARSKPAAGARPPARGGDARPKRRA